MKTPNMKKQENKALRKLAKKALSSSDVCQVYKDQILEAVPSWKVEEKELIKGNWYFMIWDDEPDVKQWIFRYDRTEGYKVWCDIRINLNTVIDEDAYYTNDWYHKDHLHTPATEEEVKQALISHAKKLGFKEGVIGICLEDGKEWICDNGFRFKSKLNELWDWNNNICLFRKGVWAELVKETITKEEAEKQLGKTII